MPQKKPLEEPSRAKLYKENKELRRQIEELESHYRAREKRKENENRKKYLSLFDHIADPVFVYDAATYRFLHCNEAAVEKYGYSCEELATMTPFDLHKAEDYGKVREGVAKRNTTAGETFIHVTKDRRERVVEIKTEEIYFEGSPAWLRIVHDITERITMAEELQRYRYRLEELVDERTAELGLTNLKLQEEILERKKAEAAIMENEAKLRNIIEKSLDGIMLVDEKGAVVEWSQGQETIYGIARGEVIGKKVWDVQYQTVPAELRTDPQIAALKKTWDDFFQTGINPFGSDLKVSRIERPDGKLRDIQQSYFTIESDNGLTMACSTRDITAVTAMEKQLTQAQKLEALGTLSGGIAHDFNNILGAILGFSELAIRKSPKDSPILKYLNQVETAARRATGLVKQILTFSRREKREKEPLAIGSIVKEVVKLMRSTLPATIDIVPRIEAEERFIMADPTQVHQVIMNLCTNAAHAMKESGGTVEVRLSEEVVEPGVYKELKPGPHVRLSVSDTGYGIAPDILDKIFEPFFTTKKLGEGTGMGLSVVHGIVKSHNGNISVYSKHGEGTTFSVLLPIIQDIVYKKQKDRNSLPHGTARVLLVEDDAALLDAEKMLLEELGYRVTGLSSGIEAAELLKTVPDRFDVVVSDYIMPRLTGLQLVEEIRRNHLAIPFILCTGYTEEIGPDLRRELGVDWVVMKPLDLAVLTEAIEKLVAPAVPKGRLPAS